MAERVFRLLRRGEGQLSLRREDDSLVVARGHIGWHSLFLLPCIVASPLMILGGCVVEVMLVRALWDEFLWPAAILAVGLVPGLAIVTWVAFCVQGLLFTRKVAIDFRRSRIEVREGIFRFGRTIASETVTIDFIVFPSRDGWNWAAILDQRFFGFRIKLVPYCGETHRAAAIRRVNRLKQEIACMFEDRVDANWSGFERENRHTMTTRLRLRLCQNFMRETRGS